MSTNIREARQRAGLTQVDLADRLGIKQQSVQRWESGGSRPSSARLAALALALGTTVDRLLAGGEQPDPDPEPIGIAALDGRDLTDAERAKVEAFIRGLLAARDA